MILLNGFKTVTFLAQSPALPFIDKLQLLLHHHPFSHNTLCPIENAVNIEAYNHGHFYYEANEASASGPHHLRGPHQNFSSVSKLDNFIM